MLCCSDSAYDALVRELKELEAKLPAEASTESVTAKVRGINVHMLGSLKESVHLPYTCLLLGFVCML